VGVADGGDLFHRRTISPRIRVGGELGVPVGQQRPPVRIEGGDGVVTDQDTT